jgi:hypothetical protein
MEHIKTARDSPLPAPPLPLWQGPLLALAGSALAVLAMPRGQALALGSALGLAHHLRLEVESIVLRVKASARHVPLNH